MSWFESLKDFLKSSSFAGFQSAEERIAKIIFRQMRKMTRRLVRDIASLILILIAVVFLALAAVFFFVEFVLLSKSLSFLVVGILILLLGILFRMVK